MAFQSILYESDGESENNASRPVPACFRDLHLDQIVDAIATPWEEYDLKPLFYVPLKTAEAVRYRHDVMRDLSNGAIFTCIDVFTKQMRVARGQLVNADKLQYTLQKQRWFLHAIQTYCAALHGLAETLSRLEIRSQGLTAFHDYVSRYVASEQLATLLSESFSLARDLGEVRYAVRIGDTGFDVRAYENEPDYSAVISRTFEKFRSEGVANYLVDLPSSTEMNHLEAKVLEFVARLNPEVFSRLESFVNRYQNFLDAVVVRFDREIHFYLAYIAYMQKFKEANVEFSFPHVSATDKAVHVEGAVDLALATKLLGTDTTVVSNDVDLSGKERILVISGPNQGGKTTFARMFGQLHYLASLGCPVPARNARLFLCDRIFTHFERGEEQLRGKLQDELTRVHAILMQASPKSIVIINEIFSSTTVTDAVFLARKVMERITHLDLLCVCVTFLDELAALGEQTVSMVSTVVPGSPAVRTYKVVRRRADGRAYAISVAERYGLTYERILTRIPPHA